MKKKYQFIGAIALICSPITIDAQLISLKTVPLATGEQFLIFPSQNLGMANVSIALDDRFLDPFVNPAKGGNHDRSYIIFAPASYKISMNEGSSRTLPLNIVISKNRWFCASSISIQELNLSKSISFRSPLSEQRLKNSYFYGSYGRKLGNGQTYLAGSLYWADLKGIDGVEYLYSGFTDFTQSGKIIDLRIGFLKQSEENYNLEVLLIHNHFEMEHAFTRFTRWGWDSSVRETEFDRTNTWGLHLGYVQSFSPESWKIGFIGTVNYKSHPKIPNYDLMRIPRDPGNTWGYNLGIGLAQESNRFKFGFDMIYEPIWSNTWADAENTIETMSGKKILEGEKTVENFFYFSNSIVRVGFTAEQKIWGFQLGLQMNVIDYDLKQNNFVEELQRKLNETWTEWTMSWGLFFKFQDFRLHYVGRVIKGTGRPGVMMEIMPWRIDDVFLNDRASNFIIAPSGSLTLEEATITRHQIILSVPI